jgi:hypothetical protein
LKIKFFADNSEKIKWTFMKQPAVKSILRIILCALLIVIGIELFLRFFYQNELEIQNDERNLTYQYDRVLGWFPKAESAMYISASKKVLVKHNKYGFRDSEHESKQKPRIMFIGDSFVWGYDVNREERFTEKLQKLIADWEVLNLGVSGYGTDQTYLLLQQEFNSYLPDIVILIISNNDRGDNCSNRRYKGYYKPFFQEENGQIALKGIPVRKSIKYYAQHYPGFFKSYFIRAVVLSYSLLIEPEIVVSDPTRAIIQSIKNYVNEQGAQFFVGFQYDDADLESYCREIEISYVKFPEADVYDDFGHHWTAEGHSYVSEQIFRLLTAAGALQKQELTQFLK